MNEEKHTLNSVNLKRSLQSAFENHQSTYQLPPQKGYPL